MNEKQVLALAKKIMEISKNGMVYGGNPASTNLIDWLMEGDQDHIKNSTIQQLADEWDE